MTETTTAPSTVGTPDDPTMRRRPAYAALAAYLTYGDGGRDTGEAISDLITDLAHLGDLLADGGRTGDDALIYGRLNYDAEKNTETGEVDPAAGWEPTHTGADLLASARLLVDGMDEWSDERADLSASEPETDPDAWHDSDDAGCEYARAAAELLRRILDAAPATD